MTVMFSLFGDRCFLTILRRPRVHIRYCSCGACSRAPRTAPARWDRTHRSVGYTLLCMNGSPPRRVVRFNSMQWLIGLGIAFLTVLMSLYRFFQ